jgi:hypothetical protein
MASRMNENIVFRCTPDLRIALESVVGGKPLSTAIREAVAEYVERHRRADEARAGSQPRAAGARS